MLAFWDVMLCSALFSMFPHFEWASGYVKSYCTQCNIPEDQNQFPDEDRDGPWNVGLLTTQPPDAVAILRIFDWI
jgi:hypothetical protein